MTNDERLIYLLVS